MKKHGAEEAPCFWNIVCKKRIFGKYNFASFELWIVILCGLLPKNQKNFVLIKIIT